MLCVDGGLQLGQRVAELVGAGGHAQRLGGQAADAFAVHREAGGAGRGNDAHHARVFQLLEHGRGDGLDLGHHQRGLLGLDQRLELRRVAHGDGARVVRHLLAGRVLVAVDRDGLHAQALQGDQHLLAEFTGAEQHHAGGGGGKGGAEGGHGRKSKRKTGKSNRRTVSHPRAGCVTRGNGVCTGAASQSKACRGGPRRSPLSFCFPSRSFLMAIQTVGIIGAGTMGNGIAQACAVAGVKVVMVDIAQAAVDKGLATVSGSLDRLIKKEKLTAEQKTAALALIKGSTNYEDLKGAQLVIEAATENHALKLKILKQVDELLAPEVIIASNTSSISITQAGRGHLAPRPLHRHALLQPGADDGAGGADPRLPHERRHARRGEGLAESSASRPSR
jgi:hypothetical protein